MRTITELFLSDTVRTEIRTVRHGRGLLISDEMNTVALLSPGDSMVSLSAMDKVLGALEQLREQLATELRTA